MENEARRILEFLGLSERLKRELRHSWLSDGRGESVAEHTWQMALVALLAYRHLEHPVDIGRVLKIILVHDLVEALAGDIPYFEVGERKELKAERERAAIEEIRIRVAGDTGQEIFELWHEFEAHTTAEARFATALESTPVRAHVGRRRCRASNSAPVPQPRSASAGGIGGKQWRSRVANSRGRARRQKGPKCSCQSSYTVARAL